MSRSNPHRHLAKKHRIIQVKKSAQHHWVDRTTYLVAIIEPIITIPQVYAIWSTRNASGVSILSWSGYWLFGLVWLYYGIIHKDKAIIIYNGLYLVAEALILIGALLYGGHW